MHQSEGRGYLRKYYVAVVKGGALHAQQKHIIRSRLSESTNRGVRSGEKIQYFVYKGGERNKGYDDGHQNPIFLLLDKSRFYSHGGGKDPP